MKSASEHFTMGQLPKPWNNAAKSITFCVTEDCNLACKYCYMTGKNRQNKLPFAVAKQAVDYILREREEFDNEAVIWEFVGGEPFLEIDLIDRICDYIKQRMFLLKHPWFDAYRFNFSTNGILYGTHKVQKYIAKNRSHLSIGISIDGNQTKHDLQRVKPDGSGSFAEVVRNVPLWLQQFPGSATKATFSHDDLPHLKDSIIALWDLGIKMVAANVVFEDVWDDGDPAIFELQLKALADYIIEHKSYYEYSVRFFDPSIGDPLSVDDLDRNFCGAGKMLAIDCQGNFYPCLRFFPISLNRKPGYKVGNIYKGIDHDRLRPFHALTLRTQSTNDCIHCDVGKGCAWCSGYNYDCADTDTIFQRATYICAMHKANVRANEYFWNKVAEATGQVSQKLRAGKHAPVMPEVRKKFMLLITSDMIVPHCNYRNRRGWNSTMSKEVFGKSLEFCRTNDFEPIVLGSAGDYVGTQGCCSIVAADTQRIPDEAITVFDNCSRKDPGRIGNCILLCNPGNLVRLAEFVDDLIPRSQRVNIVLEDVEHWSDRQLGLYDLELQKIVIRAKESYDAGHKGEINVLTDLWDLKEMSNCDAGETSFCIAPNGRIYLCPAFYFDDPDHSAGSLETGIQVRNPQLLEVERSLICSSCEAFSCKRCKFLNTKMTGEIGIPSKLQCVISHLERQTSMKLRKMVLKRPMDENDPLDLIMAMRQEAGGECDG